MYMTSPPDSHSDQYIETYMHDYISFTCTAQPQVNYPHLFSKVCKLVCLL